MTTSTTTTSTKNTSTTNNSVVSPARGANARTSVASATSAPASLASAKTAGAILVETYNPQRSKQSMCSPADWERVGPVVREALTVLHDLSPRSLSPLLTAMTRLSVWAHNEGLELSVSSLLSHATIENHVATLTGSVASFRSSLRRIAAANGVTVERTTLSIPRRSLKVPYTRADLDALFAFAENLTNNNRRTALLGALYLGAGCGIIGGELLELGHTCVHHHGDVLCVRVSKRCVPMLDEFVADFTKYSDTCKEGPFIGVKNTKNVTDRMTLWVGEPNGVPRLSGARLRAYYVCANLRAGVGVVELLNRIDVQTAEALDGYLEHIDRTPDLCPAQKTNKAARKSRTASGGRS